MKFFKVSEIYWDFDKGMTAKPQGKTACKNHGVDTVYFVSSEDKDEALELVSTNWCVFSSNIQEITEDQFKVVAE